jgi:iron complex transport system ATP-binding protein
VLSAVDVTFGYQRRSAGQGFSVRGLELTLSAGSLTGLLGPNGSGKTTLLKLLSGVLTPERGYITLAGQPLVHLPRTLVARNIATVPQETHPAFEYSCLEMVMMGRHPHLGTFELEGPSDFAIAYDAMRATGTAHLADRSYMTLSGGEKQRIVIAAALAQTSEILLLDEPTTSLDLGYQLDIANLLRGLNRDRGITMLLATHDVNLAAALCDQLILLRNGRVLTHGATRDVLTAPALAALYDVVADVRIHPDDGRLTVTALRRAGQ